MPFFLVFTGRKWKTPLGEPQISWDNAGVWEADSEQDACLIVAQQTGAASCIAVEGFAWGVDTVESPRARQLGKPLDAITRLERMGENIGAALTNLLPAAQVKELDKGDNDDTER